MSSSIQDQLPKSRLTLVYETEVEGRLAPVELPFRLLVLGDFSGRGNQTELTGDDAGAKRTSERDLDERRIRSVNADNMKAGKEPQQGPLYQLMEKLGGKEGIRATFNVANKITGGELPVDLPISSVRSFDPDQVAEAIPQLRGLLLLRKLLVEMQANLSNRKEFRKLIDQLYKDKTALKNAVDELERLTGDRAKGVKFDPKNLRLPTPSTN